MAPSGSRNNWVVHLGFATALLGIVALDFAVQGTSESLRQKRDLGMFLGIHALMWFLAYLAVLFSSRRVLTGLLAVPIVALGAVGVHWAAWIGLIILYLVRGPKR